MHEAIPKKIVHEQNTMFFSTPIPPKFVMRRDTFPHPLRIRVLWGQKMNFQKAGIVYKASQRFQRVSWFNSEDDFIG